MSPDDQQLEDVRRLWGLGGDVGLLGKVENYVYETSLDGRPVILRLTEPSHRTAGELQSELDWIDYLSKSGMRIAAPVRSTNGELVETLGGTDVFHACVFEKAKGEPVADDADFGPDFVKRWGHYIGTMHRHTQTYQRSEDVQPRSVWDEDAGFQVTRAGLDENDAVPYQRFHELMDWLGELDRSPDCFGLIHCDMHHGNFFVDDEGRVTAFDFDDSVYHWFTYDLAIPLYYLGRHSSLGQLSTRYEELLSSYLNGYAEANTMDQIWIDRLPLFIKFRTATLYHWHKATFGATPVDEAGQARRNAFYEWSQRELDAELKLF